MEKYNYLPDLTQTDVDKALADRQWEDSVVDASIFALNALDKLQKTPDEIITEVINYNVSKKIRGLFLERAKPWPKNVIWDEDISFLDAFDSLESIILYSELLKQENTAIKSMSTFITIKNKAIENKLFDWCLAIPKNYKNSFKIICTQTKLKNKYKITII